MGKFFIDSQTRKADKYFLFILPIIFMNKSIEASASLNKISEAYRNKTNKELDEARLALTRTVLSHQQVTHQEIETRLNFTLTDQQEGTFTAIEKTVLDLLLKEDELFEQTKELREKANSNNSSGIEAEVSKMLESQGFSVNPLDSDTFLKDMKKKHNGADPINTGIEKQLEMASTSTEMIQVLIASMGGTHVKRGFGKVSNENGLKLESFSEGDVMGKGETVKTYETANEFWETIFPKDSLQCFEGENAPSVVSFTPGFPITPDGNGDWKVLHFAGKCHVDELGPFDAGEKSGGDKISIIASLQKYFKTFLPAGKPMPKFVVSPNDTISTALGYEHNEKEENGRRTGALIAGTGGNFAVGARNYEGGHYEGIDFSEIDKLASGATGKYLDLECLFSGKILTPLFLTTAKGIFTHDSDIYMALEKNSDISSQIFTAVYKNDESLFPKCCNDAQKAVLKKIAEQLVERSVNTTASALLGVKKYEDDQSGEKKEIVMYGDGSLLTKNKKHVHAINEKYKELSDTSEDVLIVKGLHIHKDSEHKDKMDASFVGGAKLALGAEKEEKSAE